MKLTTKQLKQIINEELQSVIKEQKQIKEMKEFFALSDKMLMLNEGKIGDFLKKAPKWFSSKWKVIKQIADKSKLKALEIYNIFKNSKHGKQFFKILTFFKWNFKGLWMAVTDASKSFAKLQKVLG